MAYGIVNLSGCEEFLSTELLMRHFKPTTVTTVWYWDFGSGIAVDVPRLRTLAESAIAASTETPVSIISIHESDKKPPEGTHR
jgi:PKD repeat protein